MNKNRHRIILTDTRKQRTAVADNTCSGRSGTTAGETAAFCMGDLDICKPSLLRRVALHPLTLTIALTLTLGFVLVTTAGA
jgi:hypothetical protein